MSSTPLPSRRARATPASGRLLAGGTEGNERLTTVTGLLLIVLFAALGVTIIRIGQLLWLHLFLGLALIGPVALKLASTGYRFIRYYTSAEAYRRKGPPPPALRMLAPLVVALTAGVFASGVALLLIGPSSRHPLVLVHKVFFIAWIVFVAVHVLGHLPEIVRFLQGARQTRRDVIALRSGPAVPAAPGTTSTGPAGREGLAAALVAALAAGLIIAVALISQYSAWTAGGWHH